MMRRCLIWLLAWACFNAQTGAWAGPHEEGLAAGQAANPAVRGTVTTGSAAAVVPGYTTRPPETAYHGQTGLVGQGAARLAACSGRPDDIVCQAQLNAMRSANTARPTISAYDPAVRAAHDLAADPSLGLGSVAAYYSGCTTTEVTTPAGSVNKLCKRYVGVGPTRCRRDLAVEVEWVSSCTAGTWISLDQYHRPQGGKWPDTMVVEALCEPQRTDGKVRFRTHAYGGSGSCIGWVTFDIDMSQPTTDNGWVNKVATLAPDWSPGGCRALDVYQTGPGCSGDSCTKTFHYVRAGGEEHWRTLTFVRPGLVAQEVESWNDKCPAATSGGRCQVTSGERCVEGPSTRQIGVRPVTRACWAYEQTLSCSAGAGTDDCAQLAAAGCRVSSSACRQRDPTGACEVFEDTYSCPAPEQTRTTASNCPRSTFCLGSSCFNTASVKDADFGSSMSMLEAARQAGVYLDTDNMTVFNGSDERCGRRLLQNCCRADAAGQGLSNRAVFGAGSALVYDVLTSGSQSASLHKGLQALLSSSGLGSTAFSSFGVTMAVNGMPLPLGSLTLFSGPNVTLSMNPWTLAVAMVVFVPLAFLSCRDSEAALALKRGAALCHEVGEFCHHRVLGFCVERKRSHCCFNSVLARLVNEQGRAQLAKGWGAPQTPLCTGFTVAELQSLDFSTIDFTEFYAAFQPQTLDLGRAQQDNAARVPACYYGQGRC